TVIANESYEDYVRTLQAEIVEEFGEAGAPPRPVNARQKRTAQRRPLTDLPDEFRGLWEKIKHRTRYHVPVGTPKLGGAGVGALNKLKITPPRVVVTKARVEVKRDQDLFTALQMSGAKAVANLAGCFPLPNLVDKLLELLGHATPPVRLTRRMLLDIICGVRDQQMILDNPEEFAVEAARIIRERLEEHLIVAIRYEKDGEWYKMEQWEAELESSADKMTEATKSLYDRLVCDSEVERKFVRKLEQRDDVKFYVKLPAWFKVPTPVGTYNPDWALVMEERDQFGDAGAKLYLV